MAKTLVETRERSIERAWHVTIHIFTRAPHVDDLQFTVCHLFFQLGNTDLRIVSTGNPASRQLSTPPSR